jgi:hypothetical protein
MLIGWGPDDGCILLEKDIELGGASMLAFLAWERRSWRWDERWLRTRGIILREGGAELSSDRGPHGDGELEAKG